MDIETYYLSSVSVAATLLSVLLIIWAVVTLWIVLRLRKTLDSLDKLSATTLDMAHQANDVVRNTAQRIISIENAFLTAQGVKHAAYLFTNMFHNRKSYKKGDTHERE